jgi:hypothetical protein
MNLEHFDILLAIAAYLSALTTMLTAVTAFLFFAINERYGKLNDAVSVFQMIAMLPIAAALFTLMPENSRGLALLAAAVGGIGMLVATVLQAMLVAGSVSFEQTFNTVLTTGGTIGLWLVVSNALLIETEALPIGLAIVGMVAGAGYVLTMLAFRIGGQEHPLNYAGATLALLGYSAWSIWLGRLSQLEGMVV